MASFELNNSSTLTIRRATGQDAPVISAMVLRAKQSNGYDAAFMQACVDELRVTAESLSTGEQWVLEGEELVGYVCLRIDLDASCAEVEALFVEPTWHGQGLGRRLWDQVRQLAEKSGVRHMRLDADPFAVPFYQAMGLTVIAQVPSGSIPGRLLPRMQLNLDSTLG